MTGTVALDGERSVIRKWWWAAAPSKDAYELFVVEYVFADARPTSACFLDPWGQWHDYPPGGRIAPALSLPGTLVHILGAEGAFGLRRDAIEETFTKLSQRLLKEAE